MMIKHIDLEAILVLNDRYRLIKSVMKVGGQGGSEYAALRCPKPTHTFVRNFCVQRRRYKRILTLK